MEKCLSNVFYHVVLSSYNNYYIILQNILLDLTWTVLNNMSRATTKVVQLRDRMMNYQHHHLQFHDYHVVASRLRRVFLWYINHLFHKYNKYVVV